MRVNAGDSRTVAAVSAVVPGLRSALASSATTAVVSRVQARARSAFTESIAGRFFRGGARTLRASWLYRWLTAEPDPAVIVIDLRETAIVGPVLGALDWLLSRTDTCWGGSLVSGIVERGLAVLRERPIQAISTVALAGIATTLGVAIPGGTASSGAIGVWLVLGSLALAGTRLTHSAEELAETRLTRAIVAVLEPPEPPERPESHEGDP